MNLNLLQADIDIQPLSEVTQMESHRLPDEPVRRYRDKEHIHIAQRIGHTDTWRSEPWTEMDAAVDISRAHVDTNLKGNRVY